MSKLTESLTSKLANCIIENFADLYVMEDALKQIEKKHDLADPDVIAALASVADVDRAQQRLNAQPAAALVDGLDLATKLRPPAALLVAALLDAARREVAAPSPPPPAKKGPKPLPAFARPERLPPLVSPSGTQATRDEVETVVRAIAASKLGEPPEVAYTDASLAAFGRALALGWLAHGAEPKLAWGAWAAAHFPDDATAHDLGMMARELGPRVGQFSKAVVLVDVLAAMNTRAALLALLEATKVRTRSVKERARAAFDAAAKRAGVTELDLADKLLPDAEVGKDFAKRLEQRMVTGAKMSAVEFTENILQRDAVREAARGVVFGAQTKGKVVAFTIAHDDRLVGVDGKPFTLPGDANVIVVHPLDLSATQLASWRERISGAPFKQLDRPVRQWASLRAMTKHVKANIERASQGSIYGLESQGWKRGVPLGGTFASMTRELDGISVVLEFTPGIYLGRGMPPSDQNIRAIKIKGDGPPRAIAEIARELETLTATVRRAARRG